MSPGARSPRIAPLTSSQSLMWIEGQLHPELPLNNMITRLDIRFAVDVEAFRKAFVELTLRHDAMRMVVSNEGRQFVASVADNAQADLSYIDFSREPDADRAFADWMQRKCRRVFGFGEQLYEAALLKLSEQHFVYFINQHHCVTDGRSCQLMIAALDRYYCQQTGNADASGDAVTAESRSFCEYLVSRSAYLQSEDARASEAFWRERFATAAEPVQFYGSSSDNKTASVVRHSRTLPGPLSRKILDRRSDIPPSLMFTTALFAFLRRVTGNSDLCVGVPLLNRAPEFAGTLGLFMEISRNRLTISADDSLATLLDKVRAEAAIIKPHRSHTVMARNARFECLLNYRVPADVRIAGHSACLQRISSFTLLEQSPVEEAPAHLLAGRNSLEVDISHAPATGEFIVAMDFNEGVWPHSSTRERSLDHFLRLLEHFFEHGSVPIDELDLLTPEEEHLLQHWNNTGRALPPGSCVTQLFEAQVERTPDAIAVEFADECVSYRELNRLANRLARALTRRGARDDSLVGVCLDRSTGLVIAILAILKTGAGYVPLDPRYPKARLDCIIDDAGLDLIVTEQTLVDALGSDDTSEWANPEIAATPSGLAYVIFTSGSTGRPKGVMIEHRALVNFIHAAQQVLRLEAHHRLLSVTTVCFDIFALELFVPLVFGARMVLASDETMVDGHRLASEIDRRCVTHLQATPATWQLLSDADWRPAHPPTALVGGELLSAHLAEFLTSRCLQVFNWYGPTEATVWATQAVVEAGHYHVGDIGKPLANYRIHVLNPLGNPCPIGVRGELCIAGAGVARGYRGLPELTATTFVDSKRFGRLYRTGDRGRWTADGRIEFLGRSDQQVKIRGYRIELGDVEAALLTHPLVGQAVVSSVGEDETRSLAAYVRLEPSVSTIGAEDVPSAAHLRDHLKQVLPHYMIPATVDLVGGFPLTPNGKIDRNALPPPGMDRISRAGAYLAPQTPAQDTVARIWGEALGLERVGIRDDFFDLGGHSLAAMLVVARLEDEIGIRLDLADFLQGLTIEDICRMPVPMARQPGSSATVVRTIRPDGLGMALFVIDTGSPPLVAQSLQLIATEQSVYCLDVHALQHMRLVNEPAKPATIAEIAVGLADEVCKAHPHGRYVIAAGAEGAMTGFALATELQRRGEEVAQLILWRAAAPGESLPALGAAARLGQFGRKIGSLFEQIWRADKKVGAISALQRTPAPGQQLVMANDRYEPKRPFDGRIILARVSESLRRGDDSASRWARYASHGAQVQDLPGSGDTGCTDEATALLEFLQSCLAKLDRKSPD